jgi:hypothetical protein
VGMSPPSFGFNRSGAILVDSRGCLAASRSTPPLQHISVQFGEFTVLTNLTDESVVRVDQLDGGAFYLKDTLPLSRQWSLLSHPSPAPCRFPRTCR